MSSGNVARGDFHYLRRWPVLVRQRFERPFPRGRPFRAGRLARASVVSTADSGPSGGGGFACPRSAPGVVALRSALGFRGKYRARHRNVGLTRYPLFRRNPLGQNIPANPWLSEPKRHPVALCGRASDRPLPVR